MTDSIDASFALLYRVTGLDESATIRELMESLEARGWDVEYTIGDRPGLNVETATIATLIETVKEDDWKHRIKEGNEVLRDDFK